MPQVPGPLVLYVIACGCPPAAQLPGFVAEALDDGWDACVIATPAAMNFLDPAALAELTGHPVRSQYKNPGEPDVLPVPDALVIAPASFNTINKWALGISDTLALGLINEATGAGLPIAAIPWVKADLARHPAFTRSLATLREWGQRIIFSQPPPATFPWQELRAEFPRLRSAATARLRPLPRSPGRHPARLVAPSMAGPGPAVQTSLTAAGQAGPGAGQLDAAETGSSRRPVPRPETAIRPALPLARQGRSASSPA